MEEVAGFPQSLNDVIHGFMSSRCMLTALELDLFTAIGAGATAEEVAGRVGASRRGVAMLMNALVALGYLVKNAERYENTPDTARFFVRGSKEDQREGLMHMVNLWRRWSPLTEAVRQGTRIYVEPEQDARFTANFIDAMERAGSGRALLVVEALGTDGVRRVLDLGGGSGIYSVTYARASVSVECEVMDLAKVVPLTQGYVERAGLSDRIRLRVGDMLTSELGTGYDLVMLNAICHSFSEEQNRALFQRIRQALAPGGRLAVQEFLLDAAKTSPLWSVMFSVNMLVGTDAGASYSGSDLAGWMRAAGFATVEMIELPGPSDLVVGRV